MRGFSSIILNNQTRRSNHLLDLSDSNPNFWYILSQEVRCMAPIIANVALYCTDSTFSQKDLFCGWS